jgi:hypothetical protein
MAGNYSLVADYNRFWSWGWKWSWSVLKYNTLMLKELVLVVCNVVKGIAVGFSGPRNYTGTLFTSGFSFNIPTPKMWMLWSRRQS